MNAMSAFDAWVFRPTQNPQARLRLFCFPYAGGSALIYRAWSEVLPADVEVCAIELPGRGTRFKEPPFTELKPLLQALKVALRPYLNVPFAFFGHSLGALISYELTRQFQHEPGLSPQYLFVSGYRAPHLPDRTPPIHHLPEATFIEKVRAYNGTPAAVLENLELRELVIPILRADFAMTETYVYRPGIPLQCSISAFGGLQDSTVSRDELIAWREQTTRTCTSRMLPGDHFFISSAQTMLIQAITEDMRRILRQMRTSS